MRCLIIGLGNFGHTLATELTEIGHEVIGIDCKENRVEDLKDRISLAYIMDATEPIALKALPLDEIDCAVVTIGQSMDYSLRTVAALKKLKVKKIYARAIDDTHRSILSAMGINHIFIPECFAARSYAHSLSEDNFTDITL